MNKKALAELNNEIAPLFSKAMYQRQLLITGPDMEKMFAYIRAFHLSGTSLEDAVDAVMDQYCLIRKAPQISTTPQIT